MKILIIRLSSLGDIVLTTPVIRALKDHLPAAEIHYAVKENMSSAIKNHPDVAKFHLLGKNWSEFIQELKQENFDFVLDLHNNLRSHRICFALQKPVSRFHKSNVEKWKMVWLKSKIEVRHVVFRYLDTLKKLNIHVEPKKLEFYISDQEQKNAFEKLKNIPENYICIALGATFSTKKWIVSHLISFIKLLNCPVVLLGGKAEIQEAEEIQKAIPEVFNWVGQTNLGESAAILKNAQWMLTHDTGLMHIGAALDVKMCVIWGNTVPEFGMYPWKSQFISIQKNISCRPCSRLGYQKCPKRHFNCMQEIKANDVFEKINEAGWIK